MNLDLPYPYACDVLLRDGTRVRARRNSRAALHVSAAAPEANPVALRWGPPSDEASWTHLRLGAAGHLRPISGTSEDGRVAVARAIREGWPGPSADVPVGADRVHLSDSDPLVERVIWDDRAPRLAAMASRAAAIRLVDGIPYVPCPDPVVVETGPGTAEIRLARGIDWICAHPLSEAVAGFPGGPPGLALTDGYEICLPCATGIDRAHVTTRVVRKALIVLRKACETNQAARREAALADSSLAAGRFGGAAESMAGCLRALAAEAQDHPGLREFIERTGRYLGRHSAAMPG